MLTQLQASRWLTYHAAWLCDHDSRRSAGVVPLFTSMVKHYVPRRAQAIIDDALTVLGGYGYFTAQDAERRYRDNRIVECYEGTVEVQLNTIVGIIKKMSMDFIDQALL